MTARTTADYEALMLDHQYGLLEGEPLAALEAHLAGPDGERLRALAAGWTAKLGQAARAGFPTAPFAAPAPPAPRRYTRSAALAAGLAVLAASLVLAVPLLDQWGTERRARAQKEAEVAVLAAATRARAAYADRFVETKTSLEKQRDAAEAALQKVTEAEKAERAKLDRERAEREIVLKLSGPERPVPGAPNQWKVTTLDKGYRAFIPALVTMVIRNQRDEELYNVSFKDQADPTLKLPVSFWNGVKPRDELTLEITAKTRADVAVKLVEKLKLARPVYVTHLATDKPLYQPGETVRFRSLTLERSTLIPPSEDRDLSFKVVQPTGAEVPLGKGNGRLVDLRGLPVGPTPAQPLRGLGTGEWAIPDGAPGGEYSLVVSDGGTPVETRKFLVNRYVPDTFFKKLEFDGKSYGPGDTVQARAEASRTEGGPLRNVPINVSATVDGTVIPVTAPKTTDANGVVDLKFALPKEIKDGSGTLSIAFRDKADSETIVRPIPIIGRRLEIQFFPEGGDLVAGLPNRVYFQVRTPNGKPADLKGRLVDGEETVAGVQTLTDAQEAGVSRGQGSFAFTPKAGSKYRLKVDRPLNIEEPKGGFVLPATKDDGVVLTALDDVTAGDAPIRVAVQSAKSKRKLVVGAYGRGRLLDHQSVTLEPNEKSTVELGAGQVLGGVVRVTVFEEFPGDEGKADLRPVAERLVFRKAPNNLRVTAAPDKPRYNPGARVALDLKALDDREQPIPAVLMVAVVNESVIAMADNKADRLMPTHFLLAGEVRKPADLEHADFLLKDEPKAARALDLLLGTQGWRRFAEQDPAKFVAAEKEDGERLLVRCGISAAKPKPVDVLLLEKKRLDAEVEPKVEAAQAERRIAAEEVDEYTRKMLAQKEYQALRGAESQAENQVLTAERALQAVAAHGPDLRVASAISLAIVLLTGLLLIARFLLSADRPVGFLWLGGGLMVLVVGLAWLLAGGEGRRPDAAGAERDAAFAPAAAAKADRAAIPVDRLDQLLKQNADQDGFKADRGAVREKAEEAKNPVDKEAAGATRVMRALGARAAAANAPPAPAGIGGRGGFGGGFEAKPGADGILAQGPMAKRLPANRMPFAPAARRGDAAEADGPALAKAMGGGRGALSPRGRLVEVWTEQDGGIVTVQRMAPPPTVVREYAHLKVEDAFRDGLREDFAETLYWHPALVVNDGGKHRIEFDLSDAVGRYRVTVSAHTADGRVAADVSTIEARKPFSVDPKLPTEVSNTDRIDAAVRAVNDSDTARDVKFALSPEGLELLPSNLKRENDRWTDSLSLAANGRGRKVYSFKPSLTEGTAALRLDATSAGAPGDSIRRQFAVVPDGFPVSGQVSDLLEGKAVPSITIPETSLPGTLKVRLSLYPSTLADLQAGLDGLLREPGGCFEQTSTTNYPNTLILDYLKTSDQAKPEVSKRAKELIDRGYQKLTAFECQKGDGRQGFEWFGGTRPPHEALTAYGLLQFTDMARVHPVDPAMLKRTRDYLLGQRDGKGGFTRNALGLDTFGRAPEYITAAYIVWALTESDPEDKEKMDLTKEFAAMAEGAKAHDDPYYLSLVANAFLNRGKNDEATAILKKVAAKQKKPEGCIAGAQTSITSSGGRDLEIETTALATLAFLKANKPDLFTEATQRAVRWIGQQRGGYGGFGSTQSTILALKAVIAFTRASKKAPEGGTLNLYVDGKRVAKKVFSAVDREVISVDIPEPEKLFANGAGKEIRIELDAKQALPYTLMWECRTAKPASSEACALELKTALGKATANEGETVPLKVTLKNKLDKQHGMAVAVLGLPAGAKVPTDLKQLTKLREDGKIAYFELKGRELVLYWRGLDKEQSIDLSIDLVCDIPGRYRGPASRAYLYYDADNKAWNEPLGIEIKAME